MNAPESLEHLDRSQCFLLFATFAGDAVRTAAALGISPVAVLRVAEEEGWLTRLAPIIELSRSQRPGDWERACNRATNFVQAHRMRLILDRTVKRLTDMTAEELEDLIEEKHTNKDGSVTVKLSTRALADLASAIEKVQAATYQSLGDTAPERAKRKGSAEDEGDSAADIHAKLAKAMTEAGLSQSPRALLFDAQVAQGEALAEQVSRKAAKAAKAEADPLNDEDH